MIPIAHTGHWYHSLLYALPIVLIALAMWWSGRRERSRGDDRGGEPDPGSPPPASRERETGGGNAGS